MVIAKTILHGVVLSLFMLLAEFAVAWQIVSTWHGAKRSHLATSKNKTPFLYG